MGAHRAPRPLHPGARRLRQHVHVRAPRRASAPCTSCAKERPAAEAKAAARAGHAHDEDPAPTRAATAGKRGTGGTNTAAAPAAVATAVLDAPKPVKERLFADPARPRSFAAGGQRQLSDAPDALAGPGRPAGRARPVPRQAVRAAPQRRRADAAEEGLARHLGHDPRPRRQRVAAVEAADPRALRDPPVRARPRRASTRRRSSTAGGCWTPRSSSARAAPSSGHRRRRRSGRSC